MAGTTPELMRLGLEIVGANEPCKPQYSARCCDGTAPAYAPRTRPCSS